MHASLTSPISILQLNAMYEIRSDYCLLPALPSSPPHSLFGINIVQDGRSVLSFPLNHCYPSATTHGMESSASWSQLNWMTVHMCYIVFRRLLLLVHEAAWNLFQWLGMPNWLQRTAPSTNQWVNACSWSRHIPQVVNSVYIIFWIYSVHT